jgi:hypothetical protein
MEELLKVGELEGKRLVNRTVESCKLNQVLPFSLYTLPMLILLTKVPRTFATHFY